VEKEYSLGEVLLLHPRLYLLHLLHFIHLDLLHPDLHHHYLLSGADG
jgi:hypothetical protein